MYLLDVDGQPTPREKIEEGRGLTEENEDCGEEDVSRGVG
jgi:hypothetical protein